MDLLHSLARDEPIVYLGHTFPIGRHKKSEFQGILNKLKGKLKGWKAKLLSQVGRITLIIFQNAPIYSISAFKLPSGVCQQADSLVRRF